MSAAGVKRVVKVIGLLLLGLGMLLVAGWGALMLIYWDHAVPALRVTLAAAYGLISLALVAAIALPRWRWRAFGAFAALFALLVGCWLTLEPTNRRDWQPENGVLAYATIEGNRITLHNIRNFDYRTESDFTPAYYDRTFDLDQIDQVDLFADYWMGPAIAHVFVSFGFTDGNHVAVSIEARKERGEGYSSVQGFFRQYELFYAVGDERDIVRSRTNYRKDPPEDVYMYRLKGSPVNARRFFLEYLHEINGLKDHPEWYNTLTSNCTNVVWLNSRVNRGHVPYSWKILVSGYLPEYLYEHGKLDTSVPFEELRRRAHINELAHAADQDPDFSQRIRAAQRGDQAVQPGDPSK
jgi:Domain of unknown function (DUF4105)